jgi:hypothetical protein
MRDGAPRIGRPRRHYTGVYQQAVETARGYVSRPRYSMGIASRGAPGLGALPKNCHLLPSTAILEPQNRYDRLNRFNSTLALRGRAGQPRPRAENRERGREEPRCQAATECHLSHDRRIRQQSENAARRGDRRGYGRRQVGVEQRGAGTDRLPLGRRVASRPAPARSMQRPRDPWAQDARQRCLPNEPQKAQFWQLGVAIHRSAVRTDLYDGIAS